MLWLLTKCYPGGSLQLSSGIRDSRWQQDPVREPQLPTVSHLGAGAIPTSPHITCHLHWQLELSSFVCVRGKHQVSRRDSACGKAVHVCLQFILCMTPVTTLNSSPRPSWSLAPPQTTRTATGSHRCTTRPLWGATPTAASSFSTSTPPCAAGTRTAGRRSTRYGSARRARC